MTAAMTHLLEHTASDVEFDASQSDLGAALAAGDKVRDWYCRDRALALRASLEWAQELAIARPDGAPATSRSEIRATLAARLRKDISEDATLRFMDRALHVGLLVPDAEDATRYVMPIPSFAAYLRRTGGGPKEPLEAEGSEAAPGEEDPSP